MKAIIWKELRENAKWAALGLLAMLIFIVVLLYEASGQQIVRDIFVSGEIIVLFTFASCVAAPVIAMLQNSLESRRDQWAFLMHRGVSATHIFLGKAIAGLTLFGVVMLPPLLLMTLFCVWRSPEHMVFDWRMTLPILAEMLAATGLYFATALVSIRQARWYGTRLLPIIPPGLTILAMPAYMSEFSQAVPLGMFLLIALSVAVSGFAAWGAFIRSGESIQWPKLSKIALGMSLGSAFLLAAFCLAAAFVGLVYDYFDWRPSVEPSFYTYRVAANGHIIRSEFRRQPRDSRIEDQLPVSVDLDDPESQIAKKSASPMMSIAYRPNVNMGQLPLLGVRRPPLVQHLNSVDMLEWRFSTTKGLLYAYEPGVRDPATDERSPPQLKWIVGRDRFVAPPEQPQLRFGQRLTDAAISNWRFGRNWTGAGQRDGVTRASLFLCFEDGMYEIDPKALTVRQLYAAPQGKRIRSITDLPDGRMAIVFDDAINFHRPNSFDIAFGRPEGVDTQEKCAMRLTLPGDFLYSIPIPREVRAFDQFQVTRIPDDSRRLYQLLPQKSPVLDQFQAARTLPAAETPADILFVFRCNLSPQTSDITRVVTMKTDGEVVQTRDFPNWPPRGLFRQTTPGACAIDAAVPFVFVCIGALLDAIVQTWNGTRPGLFLRLVAHDPLAIVPGLFSLLAMSALSVVFARRTARRYGFCKRERRLWLAIAFLFGPTGLLSLYGLRRWPARLPCHMCGEPRAVDLETCAVCGTGPEPLPRDGTEIIAAPVVTVA